jgi:hypothetical protein
MLSHDAFRRARSRTVLHLGGPGTTLTFFYIWKINVRADWAWRVGKKLPGWVRETDPPVWDCLAAAIRSVGAVGTASFLFDGEF